MDRYDAEHRVHSLGLQGLDDRLAASQSRHVIPSIIQCGRYGPALPGSKQQAHRVFQQPFDFRQELGRLRSVGHPVVH